MTDATPLVGMPPHIGSAAGTILYLHYRRTACLHCDWLAAPYSVGANRSFAVRPEHVTDHMTLP